MSREPREGTNFHCLLSLTMLEAVSVGMTVKKVRVFGGQIATSVIAWPRPGVSPLTAVPDDEI